MAEMHLYPVHDVKQHILSPDCWCEPKYSEIIEGWVHNKSNLASKEWREEESD